MTRASTPLSSAAGAKGAVVTVADMNTLEVEADVAEASIGKITVGQPCEVQLDALPDTRLAAAVSRIVPTVRDIGLWSERVQKAYADLGGIQYAATDAQAMLDNDAKVAEEFDRRMKEGFAPAPK